MTALRTLAPAARLLLAHVSKASADASGPARAYGSVFVNNLARSAWELRRAREDDGADDLVVALHHRKVNRGKLHPPLGLRFCFGPEAVRVEASDLGDRPELLAGTSLGYRLRTALAHGARSTADLAEELDATVDTVRRTLNRQAKRGGVVRLGDNWGLAAR